jgi:methylenetetrahydrofolate dehydrogenase (NADP+)/methenyltetrahydrofolate cyclohydrolase
MPADILDGKLVADEIKQTIKKNIQSRIQHGMRAPALAVILIGDNPASTMYVANKRRACEMVGCLSYAYNLGIDTTESDLLSLIDTLNIANHIDGILVQLPLPAHINPASIIERINPKKDVDGFHPYNLGRLAQGNPFLRPCTPFGVISLLNYYQLSLAGKHAVVIGASNIVGRPMALELLNAKATVTICHRQTQGLAAHVRSADLLIVATGTYDIIDADWLQSRQIVIDIGMHRDHHGRIHGDINFNAVRPKVAWITPVPGGIGPMTISMLLYNTLSAANYLSM